ncbi:MAG: hypothetical protein H0V45_00610 [Actinobacteria bacterium]|nr:hypothetical protein [Actinomycetota bacterium]
MATNVARLEAQLSADTDRFDRAMDRSERKTHSFRNVSVGAFRAIGIAPAAAPLKDPK